MWTKIYLIALAVLLLPMAALTYYSYSWLGSIGNPQITVANYNMWSGYSWTFLWISTIVLLALANALLWKTRRAWAMWTTLVYFAVFVLLKYMWLDQSRAAFEQSNNLGQSGLSLGPVLGVVLCALAAAIVYFDQYLVLRSQEKMYPTAISTEPTLTELPPTDIDDDTERIR